MRSVMVAVTAVSLITACATGGQPGGLELAWPGPVEGDDAAIAWPFTVRGSDDPMWTGFRLRILEGAALVAVRPDAENPDPGAPVAWTGRVEGDAARWSGPPLPSGSVIALTLLLRPEGDGDPRIRVVHAPSGPAGEGNETCEMWRYDVGRERVERDPC